MGECPCSDGAYLRRRIGFTEFSEVLKGVVAAIVPELDELRSELSVAKWRIAKEGTLNTLYTNALTKEPDWGLAAKAKLDSLLLEKALGASACRCSLRSDVSAAWWSRRDGAHGTRESRPVKRKSVCYCLCGKVDLPGISDGLPRNGNHDPEKRT